MIDRKGPGIRGTGIGPSLIGDIVAIVAAVAVVGLVVADTLKLYELHWYRDHQIPILLCLVSLLIIAVIFERRITLNHFFSKTLSDIGKIQPQGLASRLADIGLSNFYTSRADYERNRGVGDLQGFLRTATKTVHIVAYWLSQGTDMEGVAHELAEIIRENDRKRVTVAIVSPRSPSRPALASYLDMSVEELTNRINSTLRQLARVHQTLNQAQKNRFQLKIYDTLPIASTIMLDVSDPEGRIQLDMKLYKTARQFSVGFEIRRARDGLYNRIQEATQQLIDEAENLDTTQYLDRVI